MFDLDGVLRVGDNPIDGVNQVFEFLQNQGIPFMISTNECRLTPASLSQVLLEMGIVVPSRVCIHTAGVSVLNYLRSKYERNRTELHVGVVGESGLAAILDTDWIVQHNQPPPIAAQNAYLIVGTVNKIEMHHLERIRTWIHSGAKVITTCCDTSDPSSKGDFTLGMPDLLIQMASGNSERKVSTYSTGKPNPLVSRAILDYFAGLGLINLKPAEILFVGDTIYTDIRLAEESGFRSALVLSGNSKRDTLEDYVTSPDYVIDSVRDVPRLLISSDFAPVDWPVLAQADGETRPKGPASVSP